jgi:hypothetical protein
MQSRALRARKKYTTLQQTEKLHLFAITSSRILLVSIRVKRLHFIALLGLVILKSAGCCLSRKRMLIQDHQGTQCELPLIAIICLLTATLVIVISRWTPLHSAAFTGQLEICHLLLDSKANVNAEDQQ